jgi:hypothetical protein
MVGAPLLPTCPPANVGAPAYVGQLLAAISGQYPRGRIAVVSFHTLIASLGKRLTSSRAFGDFHPKQFNLLAIAADSSLLYCRNDLFEKS